MHSRFGRLRTLAASRHMPDQILASLLIRHIRQPNCTNCVGREIKCLSVLGVRKNPFLAATPWSARAAKGGDVVGMDRILSARCAEGKPT